MLSKGQETQKHILTESRKLFTVQGFQNTSISQIIAATGVKKGNLYYYFPSKEELGLAVLIDARDEFFQILESSLVGENPVLKIIHSCNSILTLIQQKNFVGGCLFGNTALEMTDSNSRFGKIVQDIFSHWAKKIEYELEQAASSGLLNSKIPSTSLATAIVAILEGGIMLSRLYKNKEGLEDCILVIHSLLECKK
ncbi:MAG: TetR/AcrR family transcriptional regulator [Proteobacteria bacterium]|nr:TetR/AcrR family transcriptional regulator [Pseudomonadota bacterium]